ncbi:hypothetical protein ABID96_001306 [Bacillus sp. OAE603]
MIQRMIEIGEGYSDLYELFELAKSQKDRVKFLLKLTSDKNNQKCCTFAVILSTYFYWRISTNILLQRRYYDKREFNFEKRRTI